MGKIITLEQLAEIDMYLAKGVRVYFCKTVESGFEILRTEDFASFKAIGKELANRWRYKVLRIDIINDLICVYATFVD